MPRQAYLGNKVRRLREREGLTQVQLAQRLGISPSYLNLIEHNQRPLTVPLLLELAAQFQVELESFAADDDARLAADLREVFGDTLFDDFEVDSGELRDLVTHAPQASQAVLVLYQAYRRAREQASSLAERASQAAGDPSGALDSTMTGAPDPAEEVAALIESHHNHFEGLERCAEELVERHGLMAGELRRGLAHVLEREHGVEVAIAESSGGAEWVRRYEPERRRLVLSEVLPPASRVFQLGHQLGLLAAREPIEAVLDQAPQLSNEGRALARVALANYFAGALTMPYERFLQAAERERYDVELLEHRFRTSFEQVCHRLTTLRRPGREGVPFHLVRIDIAGNISKRYSASGIRFARFSGACPRWNVHAAFLTPGAIRTQVSIMPDGTTYFCIARTVRKAGGGHRVPQSRLAIGLGCGVEHARELVYSDGVDLGNEAARVPVGITCRLCERMDCRQRAFPPLHHKLAVDENVRGLSFYASPPPE